MNSELIVTYLITATLAGLFGVAALEAAMWLITRRGWARGNMVVAVGSLITRSRQNALGVGTAVHVLSGIFFALLYTLAAVSTGLTYWPAALALCVGISIVHGLIVTLTLVWIVAEQHPLEEFSDAGFAVGLAHFAGHVAFGVAVGLVISAMPL